jgi:hypothetical protein
MSGSNISRGATAPVGDPLLRRTVTQSELLVTLVNDDVRLLTQPDGKSVAARLGPEKIQPCRVSPDAPTGQSARFTERARAAMKALDTNADGFLSALELRLAAGPLHVRQAVLGANVSAVTGDDAAALAALLVHAKEIIKLSNDEWGWESKGITAADLEALTRPENHELFVTVLSTYETCRRRLAERTCELFAAGGPDPLALRQGAAPSCYFLAALIAQAATHPEELRRMISANADGTFTVRFAGLGREIVVPAPTDLELVRYANAGRNGLWATVMESAYVRAVQQAGLEAWGDATATPQDGIFGGRTFEGIAVLRGAERVDYVFLDGRHEGCADCLPFGPTKGSLPELDRLLTRLTADERPVVAGASFFLPHMKNLPTTLADVRGGHAYAVMGYDAAKKEVILRDPYGMPPPGSRRPPKADWFIRLPLADFARAFSDLGYERPDNEPRLHQLRRGAGETRFTSVPR